MNDLLTESESINENRFMFRYLLKLILALILFGIAYYAYACPYQEPEPIVIEISEAI